MVSAPVLTIAIPTYNMSWCLKENLQTFCSDKLKGDLEVIILNNASTDNSKEIAQEFCEQFPELFSLHDRNTRGYGASINEALLAAKGTYFRIVDADDWVNTSALECLIRELKTCHADIVQTNYEIVDMQSKACVSVPLNFDGLQYGLLYSEFECAVKTLPTIHSTTYRTNILRDSKFYMQDDTFFVDEEYIVLPFFVAKSIEYYPYSVYCYQVANPEQSTSPRNRGRYADHRDRVLKRLIAAYQDAEASNASFPIGTLTYCRRRIEDGIADHYTTLYIYVEDKKLGRKLAREWTQYLEEHSVPIHCINKRRILLLLNFLGVKPAQYVQLKRIATSLIPLFK